MTYLLNTLPQGGWMDAIGVTKTMMRAIFSTDIGIQVYYSTAVSINIFFQKRGINYLKLKNKNEQKLIT